jgi:hypothetical protein
MYLWRKKSLASKIKLKNHYLMKQWLWAPNATMTLRTYGKEKEGNSIIPIHMLIYQSPLLFSILTRYMWLLNNKSKVWFQKYKKENRILNDVAELVDYFWIIRDEDYSQEFLRIWDQRRRSGKKGKSKHSERSSS